MNVDCSVPDCNRPAKTKGWCQAHYMRWWSTGDVGEDKPVRTNLSSPEDRYAARVDRDGLIPEHRPDLGPCWVWTGAKSTAGYGSMRVDGKDTLVHRWAYERFVGFIPERFDIDHLCRNPSCVNVAHLEPVTHRENSLRGESFMAHYARRTACKYGHEYTPENVMTNPRNGARRCRECNRIKCRAAHQRRLQLKGAAA